jgi:hypothetical protein
VFTGAVADEAAVASAAVTHATTTAIPINVNLFIVFIVFPFRFESTPYAALVPDVDDEHTSSFGSANVTDVSGEVSFVLCWEQVLRNAQRR